MNDAANQPAAVARLYYVRLAGVVSGPYPMTHLRAMRQQRLLSVVHELSEDGERWIAVGDFSELKLEDPRAAGSADFDIASLLEPSGPPLPMMSTGAAGRDDELLRWWTASAALVLLTAAALPDARANESLTWWWHAIATGAWGQALFGLTTAASGTSLLALVIMRRRSAEHVQWVAGASAPLLLLAGAIAAPHAGASFLGGSLALLGAALVAASFWEQRLHHAEQAQRQRTGAASLAAGALAFAVTALVVQTGMWSIINGVIAGACAAVAALLLTDFFTMPWRRVFLANVSVLVLLGVAAVTSLLIAMGAVAGDERFEVLWLVRLAAALSSALILVIASIIAADRSGRTSAN